MKKTLLFLVLSLIYLTNIFTYSAYESKYIGTYIPEDFDKIIQKTHSYYDAIQATLDSKKYYTVLSLQENIVISNLKFHDQYALKPSEIDFSFTETNGKTILTSKVQNTNYIKISDSTEYYSAYSKYLLENVYSKIEIQGNSAQILENDGFKIWNKTWYIDKDQWHYTEGIKLLLYSKPEYDYLAIAEENGKDYFYIALDYEELQKVAVHKIENLTFDSQKAFEKYVAENYNEGEKFYDKKEYQEAIKKYQNVMNAFMSKYPEGIQAKEYYYSAYNIACCYTLLKTGQLYNNYSNAYHYLMWAIDVGYPHIEYIFKDEDVKPLFKTYPDLRKSIYKRRLKASGEL